MYCRLSMVIIAVFVAACCLISCKKKAEAPAPAPANVHTKAEYSAPASEPPAGSAMQKVESPPQEKKRKVILNHSITMEVKEVAAALEALTKLVESNGGYVFKSSRKSHDKNSSLGEVGLRVPAGKAGGVLTNIRGLGRVEGENSTAEDITEGYVDLEARLKNAKSSEARISELFRQAGKIADVLEVEKELTRVRGDIEAFEAKKKNWDILTEMVTIEVQLNVSSSGFPSFARLWKPIKTAGGTAAESFVDSMAFLVIFLCAAIPWVALFWPLYLYVKKRRKLKQETSPHVAKDTERNGEDGENHRP